MFDIVAYDGLTNSSLSRSCTVDVNTKYYIFSSWWTSTSISILIDGLQFNKGNLSNGNTYQTDFGKVTILQIVSGGHGYVLCEYIPSLSHSFNWNVSYYNEPNFREASFCMWH